MLEVQTPFLGTEEAEELLGEPDQIAEAKLSEIKAPTVDLDSSDTF
jgi:hypothetical protein